MAVSQLRVLLIGNDLTTIKRSSGSSANLADLHVTRLTRLSKTSGQFLGGKFDIILINLASSDEEKLDTIRDVQEQIGSVPILLINEGDEQAFVSKAVQCGAQDVVPSMVASYDTLLRVMLTSIERKRSEQHRIQNARRDELTGLGNRLLLEERFDRAMARADRHQTLVAMVAIDLDQPEELRASHGRRSIDDLLPIIGRRLTREIRQTDTLARTRGAGFTWLVEDLASINDVDVLVGRLPELLTTSFYPDGEEVLITASVGVAVSPFHGRDFKTLLDLAEAAMLDVATLNGDGLLMPPLPPAVEKLRIAAVF